VEIPSTKWARTRDGVDIAYQDFGEGTHTILLIHGWVSHLEVYWEQPRYERFMRRLASGMRVLVLDKRGVGMSDRVTATVDLETRADDLRAVMDAAGVERAAVLAWGTGGPALAAFFAATHPERTVALCVDTDLQWKRTEAWPYGFSPAEFDAFTEAEVASWGESLDSGYTVRHDEPGFAAWNGKMARYAATPASYEMFARTLFDTEVTDLLPSIRVPTLVVAYSGVDDDLARAQNVSSRIPESRVAVVPRTEWVVWFDEPEPFVGAIESFLGLQPPPPVGGERVLATVMFTDIVGSTPTVAAVGDATWAALLAEHDQRAQAEIARFRGRYIVSTGDGLLATFDGPTRAVRCAMAIADRIRDLGLHIRSGCHTGEVEFSGDNVRGIAVHIAARVASSADADEVVVSSMVKDLVVGSGLEFDDRGVRELKGVPGEWRLFAARR
jgi:class 3 adenylate cyclase